MRIIVLLILAMLFYSHTAFAAQPLVDPAWLETNRKNEGLVILDLQTPTNYQRHHIPRAIHTNFNDWRRQYTSGGRLVMPPPALYDGSTEEWASDPSYPMDRHVKLKF